MNLFKHINIYTWYAIAAVLYSTGEVLSKYWGIQQKWSLAIAIIISYACSTICWLGIMANKNQLALMSCLWAVFSTILATGIGVLGFNERLTPIQWGGIVLSIIGIGLLTK